MTLPKETQDRIANDADKEYPFDGIISDISANEHRRNIGRYRVGYIAGATEWAGKAKPAIDALEQIESVVSWMDDGTFKRKLLDILAKYKEVGNG
jgi:hypothetical protein